jgi:hypothetical protein
VALALDASPDTEVEPAFGSPKGLPCPEALFQVVSAG